MKNQDQTTNVNKLKNVEVLTIEEQKQIFGGATTTEYAILMGLLAVQENNTATEDLNFLSKKYTSF